jgi:hypothetical protein
MTALALDVRELDGIEIAEVAGGPLPFAIIGIRASVGGLIGGGAAYAWANRDGVITREEALQIGLAFGAGALSGGAGGVFKVLNM